MTSANCMIFVPPPLSHFTDILAQFIIWVRSHYYLLLGISFPLNADVILDGPQCLDPSIPCNNCFIIIRAALFSPFILIFGSPCINFMSNMRSLTYVIKVVIVFDALKHGCHDLACIKENLFSLLSLRMISDWQFLPSIGYWM